MDKSLVGWVGLDLEENDARLSEGHTGAELPGPSPTTVLYCCDKTAEMIEKKRTGQGVEARTFNPNFL